jgi:hypothetical protein
MENIPNEVAWVWALQYSRSPVGAETYNKVEEVIDKYPEWFRQEHIYKNIPQEVKNSFETEKDALYLSFYPRQESDIKEGEGIFNYLRRQEVLPAKINQENLEERFNYVFNVLPQKEREYKKQLKKLHLKHFGKYKYKFEE